jgi:hypothetical protein
VRDVRTLSLAAGLAALFIVSLTSIGNAASAYHSVSVSHSSASGPYSSSGSNMSRAEEPVPANCIRQSCGKLWCWQMRNDKH